MKVYSIYKITNTINQKAYVGFTSQSLDKRFGQHLSATKLGCRLVLHNAIRKYGKDCFKIELLKTSTKLDHCLRVLEPRLIKEHNTRVPSGYNLTDGGEGVVGHKNSEEHILAYTTAVKKLWKDPIWRKEMCSKLKGKKKSEEWKRKMSLAQKGRVWTRKQMKNLLKAMCKNIYLVTHPTGKIEKIINLMDFSRKHNLNHSHMYAVANGRYGRKSCNGFKVSILENNE